MVSRPLSGLSEFFYYAAIAAPSASAKLGGMIEKRNLLLKATRILRGLTQAQLAKKIGRSQTWLCQIERGLLEPSDIDVALICRVLDVTPESIFPKRGAEQC
jgi:DNA-binding XRE family transcriptional regulator